MNYSLKKYMFTVTIRANAGPAWIVSFYCHVTLRFTSSTAKRGSSCDEAGSHTDSFIAVEQKYRQ